MTRVLSERWETGPSGAACTTANTAFNRLVESGWTFSNAQLEPTAGGSLSGRCVTSAAHAQANANLPAALSSGFVRFYVYVDAYPGGTAAFLRACASTTMRAEVRFTSTGALQLRNSAFTQVGISPAGVIPLNTWCRVEWNFNNTTGKQQLQVYAGANRNGLTPDWDSGAISTTAAGTFDAVFFGVLTADTMSFFVDNFAVDDAAWVGPVATAAAGDDQTGVEPFTTVTLDGSGSSAGGASITAYNWTQTAGTAVTLSGTGAVRTFTAPGTLAGDTLTFSLTVTTSSGLTSNADTVNVTVLSTPERVLLGGTWTPARMAVFTGPAGSGGGGGGGGTGTLTLTVTPDVGFLPPRIRLDVADTRTTPATSLTVTRRNPDGRTYPVRTSDGLPLVLSDGLATVYDYEPPYDAPITYGSDQAGMATVVTELFVDDVWLVHPGVPSLSQKLHLTALDDRTRDTGRTLYQILAREDPIPVSSGARPASAATLGLRTYTEAQRAALDLLLSDDETLLLNIPAALPWGWTACYVSCGQLLEKRTVRYGRFPYREWTLPIQVVGRPGGGSQAAVTWSTVDDQYPTWQSIIDAGITSWAELAAPTT